MDPRDQSRNPDEGTRCTNGRINIPPSPAPGHQTFRMIAAMKPALFIGSSAGRLDIAYAVQESLERDVESTVWTQGIFAPSRSAVHSLLEALAVTDFALLVLAPDDVTQIRGEKVSAIRDNVIFELGLFIGGLEPERTFLLIPRGVADLHLPSDLTGVTPLEFEPNRQDGNLLAALGPACNSVRRAISKFGKLPPKTVEETATPPRQYDENDIRAILQSWMGSRPSGANSRIIHFAEVDAELKLPAGSTAKYIEAIAQRWHYRVARRGAETILFEHDPTWTPPRSGSWMSR